MATPLNDLDRGILGIALDVIGVELEGEPLDVLHMAVGTIVAAHRMEAASDARELAGLPR